MTAFLQATAAGAIAATVLAFSSITALTAAPDENPAEQNAIEYGE